MSKIHTNTQTRVIRLEERDTDTNAVKSCTFRLQGYPESELFYNDKPVYMLSLVELTVMSGIDWPTITDEFTASGIQACLSAAIQRSVNFYKRLSHGHS